eukprot:17890-Pelagomonas_calceolata.AAC.2
MRSSRNRGAWATHFAPSRGTFPAAAANRSNTGQNVPSRARIHPGKGSIGKMLADAGSENTPCISYGRGGTLALRAMRLLHQIRSQIWVCKRCVQGGTHAFKKVCMQLAAFLRIHAASSHFQQLQQQQQQQQQ